jgi:hypothetical protein
MVWRCNMSATWAVMEANMALSDEGLGLCSLGRWRTWSLGFPRL